MIDINGDNDNSWMNMCSNKVEDKKCFYRSIVRHSTLWVSGMFYARARPANCVKTFHSHNTHSGQAIYKQLITGYIQSKII